jgi:hypothetical protein
MMPEKLILVEKYFCPYCFSDMKGAGDCEICGTGVQQEDLIVNHFPACEIRIQPIRRNISIYGRGDL